MSSREVKNRWQSEGKGLSLKEFARKLIKSGDKVMKDWLGRKKRKVEKKVRISKKSR